MKKFSLIKKIVLIIVIIFLISAITFISSLFIFEEDYKAFLLGELNKLSKYQYSAETIDFIFFPDITITMTNVSVEYKKSGQSINILEAGRLAIEVPWSGLLSKKFKIKNITAENSNINLYWNLFLSTDRKKPDDSEIFSDSGPFSGLEEIALENIKVNLYDGSFKARITSGSLSCDNIKIDLGGTYSSENISSDVEIVNLILSGHKQKERFSFQGINLKSEIMYSKSYAKLAFNKTSVSCPGIINAAVAGDLSLNNKYDLNLSVTADEIMFNRLTGLISAFSGLKPKSTKTSGKNFTSVIEINSKNIVFWDRQFSDFSAKAGVNNKTINITQSRGIIYDGLIECVGFVTMEEPLKYYFQLASHNLDTKKLLSTFSDKESISGRMDSKLDLLSHGDSFDLFKKNLRSKGRITIRNGNLINQADILKPLFSLGKLVNILGPKGKSTGFKTLTVDYTISNQRVNISNLKMKGVGLDAYGDGRIDFDGSINMRITIGLGGVVGKVINVPIIYKGKVFKDWPYVDPVWIGSVYVGMVVLPGAGAIIGPKVYETIRSWFDKLKPPRKG